MRHLIPLARLRPSNRWVETLQPPTVRVVKNKPLNPDNGPDQNCYALIRPVPEAPPMKLISTIDIFKRSELSRKHKGQPFRHSLCAVGLYQLETEIEVETENPAADPLKAFVQLLPLAMDHAGKGTFRCGIFEIQTDWGIYQSLDGNRLDLARLEQVGFMTWEDDDARPIQAWTLKCASVR